MVSINLTSCYFLGPIDTDIKTKNVDFDNNDIIGTWKLDKFSYEYLSKKDKIDSIYITFNSDQTFVLNNSSSIFLPKTNTNFTKKSGIIDNSQTKGNWKILQYNTLAQKHLEFTYEDKTLQSGINVYQKDKEFQIWYFFGDPDSGERLRFLKN